MYEIVVIDNNSKDNTFEVINDLMKKYENIKFLWIMYKFERFNCTFFGNLL